MIAWLIALPALVGGAAAGLALLRRAGRAGLRLLAVTNLALVLAGTALAVVALTADPAQAGVQAAAAQEGGAGAPR